jgi:hypothetical protein
LNEFDDKRIDKTSCAYRDLLSVDRWEKFEPVALLTTVGTPTLTGRFRIQGRKGEFQVKIVPDTSIATTAGTSYVALPIPANGIAGMAVMTNDTTNIAVGVCHIDVSDSRAYLPSQTASGNTFTIAGWFEIGG